MEIVEAVFVLKKEGFKLPVVLFVGELIGKYGSDVKRFICNNGLEDDVKLIGAVPYKDMPLLYKYSLVVLYSSRSENCPNILLEAMASSSAILCSNVQPMPEFGRNAVEYFNPIDIAEIAQKLKLMVVSPERREELKKAAFKEAADFCWSKSANKTWSVILSL